MYLIIFFDDTARNSYRYRYKAYGRRDIRPDLRIFQILNRQ